MRLRIVDIAMFHYRIRDGGFQRRRLWSVLGWFLNPVICPQTSRSYYL